MNTKQKNDKMKRNTLISFLLIMVLGCQMVSAQESRAQYIKAYVSHSNNGQIKAAVENGVKAVQLYYKENKYHEAFDLLRNIDQIIMANKQGSERAALQYLTTLERLRMYEKLHKGASAIEQLNTLEARAIASGDKALINDLPYTKAQTYYTLGMNAKGDAVVGGILAKVTGIKDFDKREEAYQAIMAKGKANSNPRLVALTASTYKTWQDSVSAIRAAAKIDTLKKQITSQQATIDDKDSSISKRNATIIALGVLAAALAVALVLGALFLMRTMVVNRKQKKTIERLNEGNVQKAHFIKNISSQLTPTLQKLDNRQPEVKALQDFSEHVQQLSELEDVSHAELEMKDTQVQTFLNGIMEPFRKKAKQGVTLAVNAPNISVNLQQDYVSHILTHLLENALAYVPDNGKVTLEFKKRSAHAVRFTVYNSGDPIPEDQREIIFKPFQQVRDLTTGDGLGLPICRQMAVNLGGELFIDPECTKGTRFVLSLSA